MIMITQRSHGLDQGSHPDQGFIDYSKGRGRFIASLTSGPGVASCTRCSGPGGDTCTRWSGLGVSGGGKPWC